MERCCKRTVENLPEDIIMVILLRLPVSSIIRFRCVCKSWFELVMHDPNIVDKIKHFHDNEKKKTRLLLVPKQKNKHSLSNYKHTVISKSLVSSDSVHIRALFNYKFSARGIIIWGSCNGLICASTGPGYSIFYIWNPCTNEYVVILSPNTPVGFLTNRHFGCDHIGYGFGYDSKTSDYKFVSIFSENYGDNASKVEIYSLGTNSWKTSPSTPYKIPKGGQAGVYLNGALHWFAKMFTNTRAQILIAFSMEDEVFKEIPQPENIDKFSYKFVDVLRGCLSLLCSVSKVKFEIWVMKEYGVKESWSKVFKTDQQQLMTMNIGSCNYLRRAVSLNNDEIFLEIMKKNERKERVCVVRICLEEKDRHQSRRNYMFLKNILQMKTYVESLVSVNSGRHVGDEQEKQDYYKAIRGVRW